jgi:predicted HicB family RNase H-like nuclease
MWYLDTTWAEGMMRKPIHTSVIRFRASEQLVAAAEREADRQGMSVSELIRHALRREVKVV